MFSLSSSIQNICIPIIFKTKAIMLSCGVLFFPLFSNQWYFKILFHQGFILFQSEEDKQLQEELNMLVERLLVSIPMKSINQYSFISLRSHYCETRAYNTLKEEDIYICHHVLHRYKNNDINNFTGKDLVGKWSAIYLCS